MIAEDNTETPVSEASNSEQASESEPMAGNTASPPVETPDQKSSSLFRWWMVAIPVAAICVLAFCITIGLVVGGQQSRSDTTGAVALDADLLPTAGPVAPPKDDAITPTPTAVATSQPVVTSSTADTIPAPQEPVPELPAICTNVALQSSPTITQPVFSPVSFGTKPTPNGWPLDASVQFTNSITQIQATFTYIGMENGLPWERVWYFGEQELVRGSGTWDAGPTGHLSIFTQVQEQGFVPGRYRLELFVDGNLATEGSVVLVEAGTPITRPVQVAYTTWNGERHQIQVVDLEALPAASDKTPDVAPNPMREFARFPTWSPDTVGLLYYGEDGIEQTEEAGTPGLWVYNVGTQKSFQINEETWPQSLAWSPHRTYVASATDAPRLALWDVQQNKLFAGPPGKHPAWSSDGLRLAYRGCTGDGWGIYTANVISNVIDMGSVQQLTTNDDSHPNWSPDGQRLVFVRRSGDNQDIFSMGVDGTGLRQLTAGKNIETTPVWTEKGQILYRARHGNTWELYLMDADGGNPQILLETPSESDWEPDVPALSSNQILIEPTPPPPPKPRVQVPAGMGMLLVSNLKNPDEMTFTINNIEHKVGPYRYNTIPLPPGHYTWTASWPAKVSRTGIADVALGQVAYPVVER